MIKLRWERSGKLAWKIGLEIFWEVLTVLI